MNETKEQIARRQAAVEAHNRRIKARIPLYTRAILELKAMAVSGEEIHRVGIDTPWPKAFAPLTLDEKVLCRDEAVKRHTEAKPSARIVTPAEDEARVTTRQALPSARFEELPR